MAQTPDPDGLMQQFYPLLGGRSNVVKESRQSSCLILPHFFHQGPEPCGHRGPGCPAHRGGVQPARRQGPGGA